MAYRKSQIPSFAAIRKEIDKVAVPAFFEAVEEYAEQARDDFVARIEGQGFASFKKRLYDDSPLNPNLSAQWVRRKELAGADLRTMIATGWYIDHIEVHGRQGRTKSEPSMTFHVGFDTSLLARDLKGRTVRDMPLTRLAATHEFGTNDGNVPPRPHWGPQLNRMTRAAPKARREIAARIVKKLERSSLLRRYLEPARGRA